MKLLRNNSVRFSYRANQLARQRRQLVKLAAVFVAVTAIGLAAMYKLPPAVQAKGVAALSAGAVQPASSQAAGASVPTCSRGSYARPATPATSPIQPGLHVNLLPAAPYTIYGTSLAQIDSQMAACSPVNTGEGVGHFAASTDYAIAWAYNYQDNGAGVCQVNDVSVGLTVSQIYPAWQPTAGVTSGVAASWQRFITSLQTHEAGHAQLDQSAAANLLSDLQNLPTTACGSIVATVNTRAQADLAALDQANDNYDTATNHGATQGAVLR